MLLLSVLAALTGLAGATAYCVIEQRRQRPPLLTAGMCIEGLTLAAGAAVLGISFGLVRRLPIDRARLHQAAPRLVG